MKFDKNIFLSFFVLIVILIIFLYNCNNINENYSPIITRYSNSTINENNCKKPFTNNKKDYTCSKPVYTYQYGNRMLINPNDYNLMVQKVLKDLQDDLNFNLSLFKNDNLEEIDYTGDQSLITNFINDKLKNLSKTKEYLQNNGSWKYEYFFSSEPNIYFYKIKNNSKLFLFKITFTLENPLRSSYTNCYAFILLDKNLNNLKIIKAGIVSNDSVNIENFNSKIENNELNNITKGNLKFQFLNVLPELEYDQWSNGVNNSAIPYISEYREGHQVKIDPKIPNEFKDTSEFNIQYLPPEFGNGICDYPPIYNIDSDKKNYYLNNPPLF